MLSKWVKVFTDPLTPLTQLSFVFTNVLQVTVAEQEGRCSHSDRYWFFLLAPILSAVHDAVTDAQAAAKAAQEAAEKENKPIERQQHLSQVALIPMSAHLEKGWHKWS